MLRRRGRPLIALLAAAGLGLAVILAAPAIGVHYARSRVLPRLEERLGRRISLGELRLRWGRVELRELVVDGAGAPAPLTAPSIVVHYRMLPLLAGRVSLSSATLYQPRITIVRSESGEDNVSSILERLRAKKTEGAAGEKEQEGGRRSGPDEVEIVGGVLSLSDDSLGTIEIGALDGTARRDGPGVATLGEVEVQTATGPSAHAHKVTASFALAGARLVGTPTLEVEGGDVRIWKGFAVSGITGGITPDPSSTAEHQRVQINLRGGYGGVDKVLWSAEGSAEPRAREGTLKLVAKRFDLGQLAPILSGTPVVDPGRAEVDAHLDLAYHVIDDLPTVTSDTLPKIVPAPPRPPGRGERHAKPAPVVHASTEPKPETARREVLDFDGSFHLSGLSVFHPRLATGPVRDIGVDVSARGRLEPKARSARVDSATIEVGGVKANLQLAAWKIGDKDPTGKRKLPAFRVQLVIPPIPCATTLAAIPPALVPALDGFKLQGTFKSELHLAIDPDDLENLELGSNIGIDGCQVTQAPSSFAAERIQEPFRQAVEIEPGSWIAFDVGPDNPDWVPFADISPFLINSIMTTEDSTFLQHKGFIGREFKSALRTNLERGYFRLGASSITMQMVKNVLLSREKTLSRKLQEMFLTWYLEKSLTKQRILEVYFNVIEFGPGIYGIGRAARHYFGKPAKELQPREAAFFSSILPNPKRRYAHYCRGAPDLKWEIYLNRILRTMHARGRLSDEELDKALDSRLSFDRGEAMPMEKCLEMVRRLTAQQQGQKVAAGIEVRTSDAPIVDDGSPNGGENGEPADPDTDDTSPDEETHEEP